MSGVIYIHTLLHIFPHSFSKKVFMDNSAYHTVVQLLNLDKAFALSVSFCVSTQRIAANKIHVNFADYNLCLGKKIVGKQK